MLSVVFLAFALSVDAFVVAFSYGMILRKNLLSNALKLGLATGIGQFVMPVLGWLGTMAVHHYIEAFDHWVAFAAFAMLGINVIYEALKGDDEDEKISKNLSLQTLVTIGIATSIDACVSGISLYFLGVNIWLAAFVIGIICLSITIAGFGLSYCFKRLPTTALQIIAGLVLIALGLKVLFEHLSA